MQLLTKKQVADMCQMPVEWVEETADSGKMPSPIHLDGHKRWREKDIDEWLEAGCPHTPQSSWTMNPAQIPEGTLSLKKIEKEAIVRALKVAAGNREKAARLLEIGERTLYRKIREYRLEVKHKDIL